MDLFHSVIGPKGSSLSPILILHGLFGNHKNFQTVSKRISENLGRLVISADLRNHGKSVHFDNNGFPIGEEMNWNLMTLDITKLIELIGRRVVLMGHSLGGQVSMLTAHKNIDSRIIVDIAPRSVNFSTTPMAGYLDKMIHLSLLNVNRQEAMEEFRKIEPNETIVQFIFTNWGKLSTESEKERFKIPLEALKIGMQQLSETFEPMIHNINTVNKTPALFIKGQNSPYIREQDELLISQYFPNSDIRTVPNAGHWPHYENMSEFIKLITDYLNSSINKLK